MANKVPKVIQFIQYLIIFFVSIQSFFTTHYSTHFTPDIKVPNYLTLNYYLRLDAIESTQLMTDKRLETDISEILAKMKDLEKEQQEKIASLNLAFASLQRLFFVIIVWISIVPGFDRMRTT